MSSARYDDVKEVLSEDTFQTIQKSRVLVVGAGGIGCELLKNLVLTGFKDIVVLDLDTIDVSNLNRQFLFRNRHVNQSKAQVARESVLKFNPDVRIEAFHTKIQDPMFDYEYMRKFDVVLSALDNVQARTYLNRLCYAANVPIVESGTHGYVGQTYAVVHGVTECKECQKTSAPKTFPVCTIRNTPEEPVHCIAWAKSVFDALFGPKEQQNEMADMHINQTPEEVLELARNDHGEKKEKDSRQAGLESVLASIPDIVTEEETKKLLAERSKLHAVDDAEAFAQKVFTRHFTSELYAQRLIKTRWVNRKAPETLFLSELLSIPKASFPSRYQRTHNVQSISVYAHLLIDTITAIMRDRQEDIGNLTFDKDDQLAMDFVAAASNLRMYAYGIKMISEFEIMGIAGNIVHAIATTNAIAAGFIVLEAITALVNKKDLYSEDHAVRVKSGEKFRTIYITKRFPRLIDGNPMNPPSEDCYCGLPSLTLFADLKSMTLQSLYEDVFKDALKCDDVMLSTLVGGVNMGSFDDVEEDYPEKLEMPISELGFTHGEVVNVLMNFDGNDDTLSGDVTARFMLRLVQSDAPDQVEGKYVKKYSTFTVAGDVTSLDEAKKQAVKRSLAKAREEAAKAQEKQKSVRNDMDEKGDILLLSDDEEQAPSLSSVAVKMTDSVVTASADAEEIDLD